MFFYLLRFAVNAVAIALTAWLLPGITVVNDNIWTYLWLALGLALINTFIRPVVLLFTGQWIIATMGLLLLVINGLMLWLLTLFFPNSITTDGIVPVLLGGALIAIIATILETILGLTRPIGLTKKAAPKWYGLDRVAYGGSKRILENLRLQQIYETFYEYGLDVAIERTPLADFRRWMQTRVYRVSNETANLTLPAKVRTLLQDLGPVYVKMGQIVSSQAQALPKEWEVELAKLQSNVPPFPGKEARQIITAELGQPPEVLFAEFDEEPFAAASTAQVHRARLPNGEQVVVKVQRPNIITQVKADLGIMHNMAVTMEKRTEWAKEFNLTAMLDEYATHLLEELDYRNEAYNARQLGHNLQVYEQIHVPTIYPTLSTSKVLTMEFVKGVKITDLKSIDAAGLDRKVLADVFVRSLIKQLLFDGFFHADPHPGNILINLETGTILYLDMGMMGAMNQTQKLNLADMILSLHMSDVQELGRVIVRMSTTFKPFDEQGFHQQLERQLGRYLTFSEGTSAFSTVMGTTLGLMNEYGLRLNHDMTLAIKAISQAEEAAMTLDPMVDLVKVSVDESQRLLTQQLDSDAFVNIAKREGIRSLKEIIRRVPNLQQATVKWLDQYERGKLVVELDTSDLSSQVGQFSSAIHTLAVTFILAAIVIGTSIALAFAGQMAANTYWFLLALFCASLLVSVAIAWRMLRKMPG